MHNQNTTDPTNYLPMITLRQLEFALAVAKHRHFKRAAEECNISQSALSLGIAELERQLDTQIFERNNKQVLITPIGQALLDRAARIFLEISDLTTLAQEHQTPLAYPMTIGIVPTIAPFLLPNVLPILGDRYPNFKLNIVEKQTERLIEQVRYGQLDTAIIALPYPVEGLHVFEFWQEDFFAICPKTADNAPKQSMTSTELMENNLLLLGEGHCLTDQVLSVCRLGKTARTVFFDASLNTLIQMSMAGMGVTLVPQMALAQLNLTGKGNDCCAPNVQAVPIGEPSPHRRIAFIARLNYARVNDINLLSQIFKSALENK